MEDKKNETMKKNKKNLRWAMPMMAACLLTACSSDENAVETPQTKTITFGVTVNQASSPTTRNAEWEYEDTYTEGKALAVNWDAANDISVFHYKAATPGSWNTSAYKGSLAVNKDSQQKSVNVTIAGWTEKEDGIAAFFPYKSDYTFANGVISNIEMPSSFTQVDKNATHLSNYMYMYGTLPCGTSITNATMTLQHIPAVLRSLVINKGNAARYVKSVEIVAATGFPSKMNVTYTKQADNNFDVTMAATADINKSITVDCGKYELKATGAASYADRLMAYALCFPTATAQDYTFKVTTTDADGSNATTYTSNVVSSSLFTGTDGALKSGYYYTFELLLDDKLTASLAGVAAMPGWGDDIDIE